MSAWCRATIAQRCGGCGASIVQGAPMLVLQPRSITRRLLRCEQCAGPAPPDLPDRIETRREPLPLTRLGLLPLNFARERNRYGEREPGCDD